MRSHWNAAKGSLNLNFVIVSSHAKLSEILNEFTSLFFTTLNNKGITLKVAVLENVPEQIVFDREKYFQILFHLVTNSIKFARIENPKILILLSFVKITDDNIVKRGWQGYIKTEVIDNRAGTMNKKQESFLGL